MTKIPDLKEQHTFKVAEMRGLVETAETAKRDFSGEEKTRFDALKAETKSLEERIARAETIASFERRAEAEPVSGDPMRRELKNYSVARAIRGGLSGTLTGLEGECHAELSKGRESRGVMIPVEVLLGERRALTVGGSAGALRETTLLSEAFVDRLRPVLAVERLGATVLGGLVGNIDIPRLTTSATATFVAEDSASTRTDQVFDKVSMTPKTCAAETQFSRRLMLQSDPTIEGIVRNDLSWLLAAGLDRVAIQGGGANEPVGILSISAVPTVALGANGLTPVRANMISLMASVDDANVQSARAFLTNTKVKRIANAALDLQNRPLGLPAFFVDEPVEFSNQVPSNLVKGTSGAVCSAVIYGKWNDLFIAYWSGVDILVNPYSQDVASKGGVLIHAFLDVDIAVRHPESFSKIVDGLTP